MLIYMSLKKALKSVNFNGVFVDTHAVHSVDFVLKIKITLIASQFDLL